MLIESTTLEDLKLITPRAFSDNRGEFVKTFDLASFKKAGLCESILEHYFSTSSKNVIRGMHYQKDPDQVAKIVFASKGKILDVVLDIRKDSKSYGKHQSFELSEQNRKVLYIPEGFAHGFLSLEEGTTVHYLQSKPFSPTSDAGLAYNSFGFIWPITNPILSKRDIDHPKFKA